MSRLPQSPKNGGFTLLELLVSTTITAMILLTASTILMTFFVSNSRTTIRRQIKVEGNRALSRIEFIARGAQSCTDSNSLNTQFPGVTADNIDIVFNHLDGTRYRFFANAERNLIMRRLDTNYATVGSDEPLLTDYVIAETTNFRLQCVQVTGSNRQYASIRFDVTNPGTGTIMETFNTTTVLRNSR